eukprot:m.373713 g.373713  ORF g.373713 m.373713 type:complete len:644 (-) comp20889_c0_seq1:95-2026(-)
MATSNILMALGYSLLLCGTHGLMFQSQNVSKQWDTWAFVENGTFYAYYLITEESPGEGFGVATSVNGITDWVDHGYVWHGPSWTEHRWWEGTGSVWRAADFNQTGRYVINYSECPGGYQNITFAESYDLIHWSRPAPFNTTFFNIDTQFYKNPGRWDCIYSTPVTPTAASSRDGYPRYGFWTASPLNGTMGFGITHNGWNWEALPSPEMIPPVGAEVGAVEYITYGPQHTKGAWFAMLGHGDMSVYTAAEATGPYTLQPENPSILSGSCYFSRFFRHETGADVYVTHQSFSHQGKTYIAPYKLVDVDDNGILRLKYAPFNDAVKGTALSPAVTNSTQPSYFNGWVNVSEGIMLTATVTLPAHRAPDARGAVTDPSLAIEVDGGDAVYVSITASGGCTVGMLTGINTPTSTKVLRSWDRNLHDLNGSVSVRLLYRRDMFEVYVNDFLLAVTLLPASATGRMGVLANDHAPSISIVSRCKLLLPGQAVWPVTPPPPPPPTPHPVPKDDVAVLGTASCSGSYSPEFVCAKGNDGVLATRWSSELPYDGSSRWLAVQFAHERTIVEATLVWEKAYATGYALQSMQTSGSEWTTVYNTTTGKGGTETIKNLTGATGIAFRVLCYQRFTGSQWGFSLYELELYEKPQLS